jgi:protein TonB
MYTPRTSPAGRAGTIALVALIHVGLLYAFLTLSSTGRELAQQANLQIFDVVVPPPPPEEDPPVVQQPKPKPKEDEGAASAANIKSKATPVVAPKPRVSLPVPVPMPVAEKPSTGSDSTSGNSNVVGSGTGSGGTGNGTGSGGSGTGAGGGGESGVKLLRGITTRDYPRAVSRGWPPGGAVFVRIRVEATGRISQCDVMRSFNNAAIDQWTCSLLTQRGQFRPATNAAGQPIAAWFGYIQRETGRFER